MSADGCFLTSLAARSTTNRVSPPKFPKRRRKRDREISLERERNKELRRKRPRDPETKVVEPVVGGEPVAVRRAEEGRGEEPGPAAHDTARTISTLDPSRAVRRCADVALVVAILRPLPDIAHHVVETEPVSGKRADRRGLPGV